MQPGLPRTVPVSLWITILLGTPVAIAGLVISIAGLLFAQALLAGSDLRPWIFLRSGVEITEGRIEHKESAHYKTSKNPKNFVFDYRYLYRYQAGGQSYQGQAYSDTVFPVGHAVSVEYAPGRPDISRMLGTSSLFAGEAITAGICAIPAFGFFLLFIALSQALRYIRLVRSGILTTGVVRYKTPTGVEVNKKKVYKVCFRYKAWDGSEQEAVLCTPDVERLEDEHREPLVYDPNNMSKALLLDVMPKRIRNYLQQV